jgi:DNA replication and repair protein RecF
MITHITLSNYRNFKRFNLKLSNPHVVLYGENGAGKSNILEAISLFSIGKGLKKAAVQDIVSTNEDHHANDGWCATLTLDEDAELKTGYFPRLDNTFKKNSFIQNIPIKSHVEFAEWLNVLWITPETDQLFLESPSVRRKFIDRFVYAYDSTHLKRVMRFEHAVQERMKILKNYGVSETHWLDALEQTIAEEGTSIAYARKTMLQKLSSFKSFEPGESVLPNFIAHMQGAFEELINAFEGTGGCEAYRKKLAENRSQDLMIGMTRLGPHRSDFYMYHPVKKADVFKCSTGEQKVLLLSLLIAFIEQICFSKDVLTVFLLDDVIAHLDNNHRAILFSRLTQSENKYFQAWFSGTDASFFEAIKNKADFIEIKT